MMDIKIIKIEDKGYPQILKEIYGPQNNYISTSAINLTLTILEIKNAIRNFGKNNYIIK